MSSAKSALHRADQLLPAIHQRPLRPVARPVAHHLQAQEASLEAGVPACLLQARTYFK